jgi:hypothetical protein
MGTTSSQRDKLAAAYVMNSPFIMDCAPAGADLHQSACQEYGVRYQGPGIRRRAARAARHLPRRCGRSLSVRIYLPDGFTAKRVELSEGLTAKMATNEHVLTVDLTSSTGKDVDWKVIF